MSSTKFSHPKIETLFLLNIIISKYFAIDPQEESNCNQISKNETKVIDAV